MSPRGLLSRLDRKKAASRSDDELGSIVDNLRALLNTRTGDAATVPDFGIPDFSDVVHNCPAAIQTLQRAIRATILTYETRLKNVSVRYTPDEDLLVLKFEITAQLSGQRTRGLLKFRTEVKPGGKVDIQG